MSNSPVAPSREIAALLDIMARLRDPAGGCPWDVAQSFETIAPYTIEEAYEVADAIARGDLRDLRDELGDLLLQVVFHARMAEEAQEFDFGGVVEAITAKLIRRHPHVFGSPHGASVEDVATIWRDIKEAELRERHATRGGAAPDASVLDGVPLGLPALVRADKLTRKAAAVGFSWQATEDVVAKIEEELGEVREAVELGDRAAAADEIGDLLFTVANLARHLDVDPEEALRAANRKFERRFRGIERRLAADRRTPGQSDLAEMDRLWGEVKAEERTAARDAKGD